MILKVVSSETHPTIPDVFSFLPSKKTTAEDKIPESLRLVADASLHQPNYPNTIVPRVIRAFCVSAPAGRKIRRSFGAAVAAFFGGTTGNFASTYAALKRARSRFYPLPHGGHDIFIGDDSNSTSSQQFSPTAPNDARLAPPTR